MRKNKYISKKTNQIQRKMETTKISSLQRLQSRKTKFTWNLALDNTPLNQMMVDDIERSDVGFNDSYDAKMINNARSISRIIYNEKYVIQARTTTFVNSGEVPLNYKAGTVVSYTLSLNHLAR